MGSIYSRLISIWRFWVSCFLICLLSFFVIAVFGLVSIEFWLLCTWSMLLILSLFELREFSECLSKSVSRIDFWALTPRWLFMKKSLASPTLLSSKNSYLPVFGLTVLNRSSLVYEGCTLASIFFTVLLLDLFSPIEWFRRSKFCASWLLMLLFSKSTKFAYLPSGWLGRDRDRLYLFLPPYLRFSILRNSFRSLACFTAFSISLNR